jgi:hypothetical protein
VNFSVHFLALALALAGLLFYRQLPGHDQLLPSAALYGAVHAVCVVAALIHAPTRGRRLALVGLAALVDVGVLYLGIGVAGLLSALPSAVILLVALGSCALLGAVGYGLLLRALLFPALRPRQIAQIALGCFLACLLLAATGLVHAPADGLWLVGAWWLGFSSGLWIVQRRAHVLGPQPHAEDLRRPAP